MSVVLGILVFVGGSAWAVAANQVLKDSKLPNHAALFIYAGVVTVVLILVGVVIGFIVRQLKIDVPLDVTSVIVAPTTEPPKAGAGGHAAGRRPGPPPQPTQTQTQSSSTILPLLSFRLRRPGPPATQRG